MVFAQSLEASAPLVQVSKPPSNFRALRACPDRSQEVSALDFSSPNHHCPTMFSCNPFRNNTYSIVCKCSFQKTYGKAKSFRIHTYKKPGGGVPCWPAVAAAYLRRQVGPVASLWSGRQRAVGAPLYINGKCPLSLFSSHRCRNFSPQRRGSTPTPSFKGAFLRRSSLCVSVSL
jgi:hypothetical protein